MTCAYPCQRKKHGVITVAPCDFPSFYTLYGVDQLFYINQIIGMVESDSIDRSWEIITTKITRLTPTPKLGFCRFPVEHHGGDGSAGDHHHER